MNSLEISLTTLIFYSQYLRMPSSVILVAVTKGKRWLIEQTTDVWNCRRKTFFVNKKGQSYEEIAKMPIDVTMEKMYIFLCISNFEETWRKWYWASALPWLNGLNDAFSATCWYCFLYEKQRKKGVCRCLLLLVSHQDETRCKQWFSPIVPCNTLYFIFYLLFAKRKEIWIMPFYGAEMIQKIRYRGTLTQK